MKLLQQLFTLLALCIALRLSGAPYVKANPIPPAETPQSATQPPQMDLQVEAMRGLSGWSRSIATVSIVMESGMTDLEMRVDGGDWRSDHSFKLTKDGVYQVEARATTVGGNLIIVSKEIKIDQHDPIGQFTAPQGGTAVQGIVQVQGTVHDELSGMGQVGISLDDGKTWKAVPFKEDGRWSVTWDTRSDPDSMHALQAKFTDLAGNTSSAEIFYIVANHPAKIHLTPRWEVGDKGKFDILPGDTMLMDVTLDISDPKGRWPDIHLDYSPNHVPKEIVWDGRFGQTSAPGGEYSVTVRVTDLMAQQVEAHGVIVIPLAGTPEVLQTLPTTTGLLASGATAQRPNATLSPVPTSTATALPTLITVMKTYDPPLDPSPWSFLRWLILLAGAGALVAFAWSATRGPRARDMKKQGQSISEVQPPNEP